MSDVRSSESTHFIYSAKKMAEGFKDAVVLTQDSPGVRLSTLTSNNHDHALTLGFSIVPSTPLRSAPSAIFDGTSKTGRCHHLILSANPFRRTRSPESLHDRARLLSKLHLTSQKTRGRSWTPFPSYPRSSGQLHSLLAVPSSDSMANERIRIEQVFRANDVSYSTANLETARKKFCCTR
jgi:hypothetical protein